MSETDTPEYLRIYREMVKEARAEVAALWEPGTNAVEFVGVEARVSPVSSDHCVTMRFKLNGVEHSASIRVAAATSNSRRRVAAEMYQALGNAIAADLLEQWGGEITGTKP